MEVVCPIDAQFPQQISLLLEPPSSLQVQEYFDDLITSKQRHGIQVKPTNDHGKGVYVDLDFEEGDLVLKDQMLFGVQHSSNKIDCLVCSFCFRFIGSIELQIGRKLYLQGLGNPKDCFDLASSDGSDKEDQLEFQQCSSTSSRNKFQVPTERVESLMQEKLALPYSMKFPLPSVNICPGGCKEAYYCSKSCAQADWDLCHSLLCTGEESKSLSKKALSRFIEHANETNDIFLLAAKAICCTILKYRKLKAACSKEKEKNSISNGLSNHNFALLLKAWKPISMGYKRSCVVHNRAYGKKMMLAMGRELHESKLLHACDSDLVVASPVEDYFLYIDDLPEAEKKEAGEMTRPFLDALGEDYSVCCQGTAFFPIQSCMNHSCCPSAKAFKRDEDRDGQAAIIACRPITKGEEVTISYIDEDLQLEERQALLADYGFRCKCPRCTQEEAGLVYTKIQ
ncbi:hypothetical protein Ccrd_001300 [Cynara cardunculus var. scolymus]|uniref:SET domain-containing protein n=1 Tax=Cynara cardunculus var. scolymus TaxID=59895 RepID=A0A118JXA3_CYNCS|nr:hypothetical protein Ccrd_001300 [Cynara cardunculus var. scolymus]